MHPAQALDSCYAAVNVQLHDGGVLSMLPSTYFYAGDVSGDWCGSCADDDATMGSRESRLVC